VLAHLEAIAAETPDTPVVPPLPDRTSDPVENLLGFLGHRPGTATALAPDAIDRLRSVPSEVLRPALLGALAQPTAVDRLLGALSDRSLERLLDMLSGSRDPDPLGPLAGGLVQAWVDELEGPGPDAGALRRENSAMAYALSVHEPEATEETPEDYSLASERAVRVRQAFRYLPPDQLEVTKLSYFEDKPHAEIAEKLSLPLGTVKSRLRLAMARLRGIVGVLS